MFADASETRADPEERLVGFGEGGEDRLADERGDEFAQLRAGDLKKRRGDRGAVAKSGKDRQGRQLRGRGRRGRIKSNFQRDGVTRGGGGKIGREKKTQHAE
jgi:hypothetical protein